MTERANLPMLTLSYSDLITSRGFKYIFQTSATAGSQAEQSLPVIVKTRRKRRPGTKPKTVAIITDNTAASISSVKPMKERLLKELGIELVVDETFTPPLADATPLVQKVRAARPDLLFFLPTVISDAKLMLEKMNEFGIGQGKVPVDLVRHRHRRAGHAAHHGARAAAGRDGRGRQLGPPRATRT